MGCLLVNHGSASKSNREIVGEIGSDLAKSSRSLIGSVEVPSSPAVKLKLLKWKIKLGTKETMLELMAAIELVEGLILATTPT